MEVVRLSVPPEKMQTTVQFYADGLGLDEDPGAADFKTFRVGRQRIELIPSDDPPDEVTSRVRFHVHGIKECVTYLVAEGYLARSSLVDDRADRLELRINDPAGNPITLLDADQHIAPVRGR